MNILIVEDERITAENIKELLEANDYSAFIAHNSDQAKDLFALHRIDLILFDIELKGSPLNGIELAAELMQIKPTRHLYLSAKHKAAAIVDQAQTTQPTGFVTKPYHNEQILMAIKMAFTKPLPQTQITPSIFLNVDGQKIRIKIEDIFYAQAAHMETYLCLLNKEKLIVKTNLSNFLAQTNGQLFRTHDSFAINPEYIHGYKTDSVILKHEDFTKEISLSKTYYKSFRAAFPSIRTKPKW